jgi:hypothetical protein
LPIFGTDRSLAEFCNTITQQADIFRRLLQVGFGPESAVSRCSKNLLSKVGYFHLDVWCGKTPAPLNDTMPFAAMHCSKSKMFRNVSFLPRPASKVTGDRGSVHRGDDPCPISVKPREKSRRLDRRGNCRQPRQLKSAANSHVEGWRRRYCFRACSYAARGLSSCSWSPSTCRAFL